MAVIPFGIVGVILGLLFTGQPMGLMSIMGTIALAGIVVNNSVVFVDFINRFRAGHAGSHGHIVTGEIAASTAARDTKFARWRSIIESGCTRFRPIFLTTATTVAGLWNLAFMSTGQEQFLAPMAQAIVWGLTFATLITLVLIPVLYAILDDLHHAVASRRAAADRAGFPSPA
jgi:multidrug efflux pump subunit AcrB